MEIRVKVARYKRKDVMAREEAQHTNKEGQERKVFHTKTLLLYALLL